MSSFIKIDSIGALHNIIGLGTPSHPLITILDYSKFTPEATYENIKFVTACYLISLKIPAPKTMRYGRQYYDFDQGTLMFMSPGQVFSVGEIEQNVHAEGWGMFFHPDLILGTPLAKKIKEYSFFSYDTNEALHVSEIEKQTLTQIIGNIEREYKSNIDRFSHAVIVTAIEQILNYSERFYSRQFITRRTPNREILSNFETLVHQYFSLSVSERKLPTVEYFASAMNLSPGYLSDLLKHETGKTAKEHLHIYLIEEAKNLLLNSNKNINEIAFDLGFEYPQYFNRLFKGKVGMTPLEFRSHN
jgi:AraC-like DNA-binding protein